MSGFAFALAQDRIARLAPAWKGVVARKRIDLETILEAFEFFEDRGFPANGELGGGQVGGVMVQENRERRENRVPMSCHDAFHDMASAG